MSNETQFLFNPLVSLLKKWATPNDMSDITVSSSQLSVSERISHFGDTILQKLSYENFDLLKNFSGADLQTQFVGRCHINLVARKFVMI